MSTTHIPKQYFEYIDYVTQHAACLPVKPAGYYFEKAKLISGIINHLPVGVYILDYRAGKYLFISTNCEQILGYTHKEIMKNGQQWWVKNNLHPDDLAIYSSDIFLRFLAHTRSFPKEELPNIRFSINYRCKRKDGVYIHALQQYYVLDTDDNGYPLVTFGTLADITAHKTDTKMVMSVSRYHKKTGFSVIATDSFPHCKVQITKRESDVIRHLVKGNSSKQIADKLHLSLHTVNAHRRNILQKTNCKNTAELICYALENGLG